MPELTSVHSGEGVRAFVSAGPKEIIHLKHLGRSQLNGRCEGRYSQLVQSLHVCAGDGRAGQDEQGICNCCTTRSLRAVDATKDTHVV